LPSWNNGSAKNAILEFAHATTDPELEIRAADGNDNVWTVPVGGGGWTINPQSSVPVPEISWELPKRNC